MKEHRLKYNGNGIRELKKRIGLFKSGAGFTLIELLIVIAVLGILSGGVLTAINITGNINKANLAKAKTFSASIENSLSINQVGKWSFEDDPLIGGVDDTSGYSRTGIVFGSPSQVPNEALGGNTLDFNGSTDYITVTGTSGIDFSQSFTITAWVNLDRFGDPSSNCGDRRAMIVRKGGNNPGTVEFGTRGAGSDDFKFAVRRSSMSWVERSLGKAPLNKWHHISLSYESNSGTIKAYLNGRMTVGPESIGALASSPGDMFIGGRTPNCTLSYTDGRIDEVAIYNQSLTASQIQNLYTQGLLRHQLAHK